MNWQPPDPPEYGTCNTCDSVIHQSEVRGDRCIECEGQSVGDKIEVPRDLLQRIAQWGSVTWPDKNELMALLSAQVQPADVSPAACIHGEPDDDAACMDCLKAWGQYPFAAPVVERHPVAWFRSDALGCVMWKPRASIALKEGDPLYTAPPELAELQATIARLEREQKNDAIAYKAAIEKQDELRAEIERLKSESFESLYNDAVDEIERLKGGHGEPIHQLSGRMQHTSPSWTDVNKEVFDEYTSRGGDWVTRTLYTSQPAPVSVALPEPEQLFEAIAGALGEAMDCTRVWAAWGAGTMSEDDFVLVADDQERLREIASACLDKIKEANQ